MKKRVLIPDVLFFQEGPGVRKNQYTDYGVKLLNVSNLVNGHVDLSTSDRYISEEEAYGKYKHFLVDEGDFIIASSGIKVEYFDKKMGFINKSHLPLCMNTSTIRFKSLDNSILNIRYFMYFLKSNDFKYQLFRNITGSAQLNFGPSHLKKMKLPIIDIHKQKQIVSILDTVSKIIEKRKKQLEDLDELVKARFVEMFGDPVENSMGWDVVSLSLHALKIGSGATPKGGKESYISEGISLVRSMNVYDGEFKYKDLAHITNEQAKLLDNVNVEKNDIFINITGASVARTCIAPENILPARVNQHVSIIRVPQNIYNSIFLNQHLINDSYKFKLLSIGESGGATRQAITKQQLESLLIILPPIELQNQFADFVKQTEEIKENVQKSLDETQVLFDKLMQDYF